MKFVKYIFPLLVDLPLLKRLFNTNSIKSIMVIISMLSVGRGLSSGDIAFTAFNADGDDDFAIVVLADISTNTNIYFSDKDPNSDGSGFVGTSEGILKWDTGNSTISAGTIVVFTDVDLESNTNFGSSEGSLSDASFDAGFNLAGSGDALYAVEGSDNGSSLTIIAWLAGIQNESGNEGSNFDQTGLTSGLTFINFYSSGNPDGGYYSGDRQGQSSFSDYLTHLGNNSKWVTETSIGENILPISTSTFSLGITISGVSGFRMMSSPVAGQIYSDLLAGLWTQGMTGGDVTSGSANVWTFDVSGQSWTALTNLSTASLTAGEGFLVYVFDDTDNNGSADLPVSLNVSGIENSSSASIGSIANGNWALAGNPYAQTIDWDLVTQTNLVTSAYVWDDAVSAYKSWNGITGDLSNGLIAPYQSFWVQANGGTGSFTIETADKSSTAGTFYKVLADSSGNMSFTITAGDYSDQAFVSFMTSGKAGMDNADAYKLLPMTPSESVVGISYAGGNGLDINNLPFIYEGSISVPLDVMSLTLDENYNFICQEQEVTMTWDLSNLPVHITLTLSDNITGNMIDLTQDSEFTFSTVEKGSFPSTGSGAVDVYPQVGESHFTMTVSYSALSSDNESTNLPEGFVLHPVFPNPFNSSTTIKFDVDATSTSLLQVFDIQGKLIETLINRTLPAGSHSIQWNPKNLSSGLYIVQLKSGGKIAYQKITLLK